MPRWTDEARARQAEQIRKTRPWDHATGPKTPAGKKRSARNAYKHGLYSASGLALHTAMGRQSQFLHILCHLLKEGE